MEYIAAAVNISNTYLRITQHIDNTHDIHTLTSLELNDLYPWVHDQMEENGITRVSFTSRYGLVTTIVRADTL